MEKNAREPIFNEDRIRISARLDPLFPGSRRFPSTSVLGKEFDLLIITGPNTGGKTVSLKTAGLFTLTGQSGLHIPALDRWELAMFREVYADIGDEQSIEQTLSTFSSHMTYIVSFLENADEESLCLLRSWARAPIPQRGRPWLSHPLLPPRAGNPYYGHHPLQRAEGICPLHIGCGKCLLGNLMWNPFAPPTACSSASREEQRLCHLIKAGPFR